MTKKSYSEKLRDPRWQIARLRVFERDGFKCVLCGDKETTLHVHHLEYHGSNPWETPLECLKTLCSHCHPVAECIKEFDNTFPVFVLKSVKSDGSVYLMTPMYDKVQIFHIEHSDPMGTIKHVLGLTSKGLADLTGLFDKYILTKSNQ